MHKRWNELTAKFHATADMIFSRTGWRMRVVLRSYRVHQALERNVNAACATTKHEVITALASWHVFHLKEVNRDCDPPKQKTPMCIRRMPIGVANLSFQPSRARPREHRAIIVEQVYDDAGCDSRWRSATVVDQSLACPSTSTALYCRSTTVPNRQLLSTSARAAKVSYAFHEANGTNDHSTFTIKELKQ